MALDCRRSPAASRGAVRAHGRRLDRADRRFLTACALGAGLVLAAGCRTPPAPLAAPPPVPVQAMTVIERDTPIYQEYVGEVRGIQEVDLRSRVSGILVSVHFRDGQIVKKGERLFQIDPRPFEAELANAQGNLAGAQAEVARANLDVERYKPLVPVNAIPKQVYDNAVAAAEQASARVEALRASITQARLDIEFSRITSPVTGRIGRRAVDPGALVTAGTTVLGTVSLDDPAYVYFSISETSLIELQRRFTKRPERPEDAGPISRVTLTLSDGTPYPLPGTINFADRSIDPQTGTFTLRASFPNPDRRLLSGQYARVQFLYDTRPKALLVPERAVTETLGTFSVVVVGEGEKAEVRQVTPGPRTGRLWVIDRGLKPGERVVVEGLQRARPGAALAVTAITEAEATGVAK